MRCATAFHVDGSSAFFFFFKMLLLALLLLHELQHVRERHKERKGEAESADVVGMSRCHLTIVFDVNFVGCASSCDIFENIASLFSGEVDASLGREERRNPLCRKQTNNPEWEGSFFIELASRGGRS